MTILRKQFCINGHDTFIVGRDKTGHCVECKRKHKRDYARINVNKSKKYYVKNRIIILRQKQEYQLTHKEQIKLRKHKYYLDHIDHIRNYQKERLEAIQEYQKQYAKDHPGYFKLHSLLQNINRSLRVVSWEQKGIKEFYANCPNGMVVDHIIPLLGKKVSGLHILSNLQYLTTEENSFKSNKWDGTLENISWRIQFLNQVGK